MSNRKSCATYCMGTLSGVVANLILRGEVHPATTVDVREKPPPFGWLYGWHQVQCPHGRNYYAKYQFGGAGELEGNPDE